MRRMSTMRPILFLAMTVVACGGESSTPSDAAGGADAGPPDAGACTEEPCLAPPAMGFQIRSVGTTIQPGEDVEYCEVLVLPGTPDDTYYVHGFDVAMTGGSHHLIVSAIVPGSATDMNTTVGDRVECVGAQNLGDGDDFEPVTGSQHPTNSERYPSGVGRIYHGGQKVVFDYHYFNTTDGPLSARAAVNFLTTDPANITNLARTFGFFHLGISTPPGQQAAFEGECTFNQDVVMYKLTRHTHQWGRDFNVWYAGGPNDGQLIFTSPDYETDTDFIFDTPVTIPTGQGFRFECNYDNTTDQTLVFGTEATDEMCILFGTWYTPTAGGTAMDQDCVVF